VERRGDGAAHLLPHSIDAPETDLIERGPWIMAQKAGGPLAAIVAAFAWSARSRILAVAAVSVGPAQSQPT
jgi:hypothetical protein